MSEDNPPKHPPSAPEGPGGDADTPVPSPSPPPDDESSGTAEPSEPAGPVTGAGGSARPGDLASVDEPEPGEPQERTGDESERQERTEPTASGGPSESQTPSGPDRQAGNDEQGERGGQAAGGRPGGSQDRGTSRLQGGRDRSGEERAEGGGDGGDGDGGERVLPVPAAASPAAASHIPDPAHDLEQRKREAGVDQGFPFGRPGQPLGRAHPFVFGFTGALGVMTAYLLVRAAANAQSVLIMLTVAMFLAVGLNPAVERIRRLGLSRGWAVTVVFFGVLLFFSGFVASLVPPLTEQITALTRSVPDYIQQLQSNQKIADWDQRYHLLEQAQKKINDPEFQETLASRAYEVGRQAVSGTVQTLTILILTLYFLGSLPQIKTFAYQLAPRSRRARVALLGDEILTRIGGYVAGQFTIAFIAGLFSYIFLEILGLPYALALSLIVAVTALIPLIGATIGAVVVTLVAFLNGVPEGIASIVFYVIYQQVENYVIYPRIMKRTVDVQPAVTVVAALVGAALVGVIGALLAIPTAAAISLVIREVFLPRQESL